MIRHNRTRAIQTLLAVLTLGLLLFAACRPPQELITTPTPRSVTTPVPKQPAAPSLSTPTPTSRQPGALPVPTASPGTPAPAPSAVSQAELSRLSDIVFNHIRQLSVNLGLRTSATPKEKAAADYIEGTLRQLGYQTSQSAFTVRSFSTKSPRLTVGKPSSQVIEANPMTLSAVAAVTAPLIEAGLGREEDFPPQGLQGQVALIGRGSISFEIKTSNAVKAGATAVVIYNNESGNFYGSLQTQSTVPVVSISQEDGQRLKELLKQGVVEVTVRVEIQEDASQNVVATKQGGEKIIIVGGHYDTTELGPGANDNASGTSVMLTVAQELSRRSLKHTIRFIAFGSEELGLFGSRNYVQSLSQEEQQRITAMINLDGLAAGRNLGVGGEPALASQALDLAYMLNLRAVQSKEPANTASDHFSFLRAGVPSIFIFGSDFSRFHTPEDTIDFVDKELLGHAAQLTLALIEALDAQ